MSAVVSPGRRRVSPGGRAVSHVRTVSRATAVRDERGRRPLVDSLIMDNLGLAYAEAARYRNRGIPLDDLRQVAALALTKAANRFDPRAGHPFPCYAVPTIRGELRRHFRDHGWMIRPPRRIQELQSRINIAEQELSSRLGRSPKPKEVAAQLRESTESVIEAIASDGCFHPASLDHPVGGETGSMLVDVLLDEDTDHAAAEARLVLAPAISRLGERDQAILAMRFFEGLTQCEIAARIGVSQMQVSRLLTRILGQLRTDLGDLPD